MVRLMRVRFMRVNGQVRGFVGGEEKCAVLLLVILKEDDLNSMLFHEMKWPRKNVNFSINFGLPVSNNFNS